MSDKISVIFPIFNNEDYIETCIRSVMNQTLRDIEMILIDDGSTDSAPEICDRLAAEDPRIKVVHKKNEGVAKGENLGIDMATGEYIAFVEADDRILPEMYDEMYKVAKNTDADIVKCGFSYYDGQLQEVTSLYSLAREGEVFRAVDKPDIFMYHASMWAAIYKTSFIRNNNIRNIETPSASYTDFSWMAATYAKAEKITIVHKPFYIYTFDNANASNKQDGEKCYYKPYHCLMANKILREAGIFEQVKEEIGYQEYKTCSNHARRIRADLREEYFKRFRAVLQDLAGDGNYQFKHFFFMEKSTAKMLLKGDFKGYYRRVEMVLFIKKIIQPLKNSKLINKMIWNLKQFKFNLTRKSNNAR